MVAITITVVICITAVTIVGMVCSNKRISTMELIENAVRRLDRMGEDNV